MSAINPVESTRIEFEHLLSSRAAIGWGRPKPEYLERPLYELGAGFPDPESFPYAELAEATARVMREDGAAALGYGDPQGYLGLREIVCEKYRVLEKMNVAPENIVIANGAGHALALALSAFVDVGDAIICEAPAFWGSLAVIRRHGPRILDVPVDGEGIVTAAVRERLEQLRREGRPCKLIYTIDNFQNPSGVTQSLHRRRELVALAHEYGTFIVEDDAYGELRFEGQSLPSLYAIDGGRRVIRLGTLSKILGAGLRLGWVCAPREMIPAFQSFLYGGGTSPYASRIAACFLRQHMLAHIARLVEVYREKRDAMLQGLREVLAETDADFVSPQGGFFFWLRLPSDTDVAQLNAAAHAAGVQYAPGPAFYPNGGGAEFIRLTYSYESPPKCYEGARVIARAMLAARR